MNRRGQSFAFAFLMYLPVATIASAQAKPNTSTSSAIPAKASRHVEKGVIALRAEDFKAARKQLTAAYQASPNNPDICYLLGVAYARSKDLENGRSYLQRAIVLAPDNVPALLALGQLHDLSGDYAEASRLLERAVLLDANQWLATWVLADVNFRRGDYEKARQAAEEAVKRGEGAANKAEFIAGEALAELGRREDSEKRFESFLRDMPEDPAAPAARMFLAILQQTGSSQSSAGEKDEVSQQPVASPDLTLPPFGILISTWGPSDVDQARPAVSDTAACPVDQVIQGASERVGELVENVNNIDATEKVDYETLNAMGRATSTQSRSYDYLALISDNARGLPMIEENRKEISGRENLPQGIAPFALQGLALIFHPELRVDFQMTCEGLGNWRGQPAWVVYFRQNPNRPKRLRSYKATNGRLFAVGLKGRAWILADSFQIVRMEADIMAPVLAIGLVSEEDAIEYGPVVFQSKKTELWLPISADSYFYYHHHAYRRHHAFTNYRLFSVGSTQSISLPKEIDDN